MPEQKISPPARIARRLAMAEPGREIEAGGRAPG